MSIATTCLAQKVLILVLFLPHGWAEWEKGSTARIKLISMAAKTQERVRMRKGGTTSARSRSRGLGARPAGAERALVPCVTPYALASTHPPADPRALRLQRLSHFLSRGLVPQRLTWRTPQTNLVSDHLGALCVRITLMGQGFCSKLVSPKSANGQCPNTADQHPKLGMLMLCYFNSPEPALLCMMHLLFMTSLQLSDQLVLAQAQHA